MEEKKFEESGLSKWGLMHAIWNCDHELAKQLVEAGVELNFQNENGYTPVHALTYMHQRKKQPTDYELMKMMLDRGANPDTPSYDGDYPLQALAAGEYFDDIFKLILEYKPNVYQDFGHASCKLLCEDYPEIDQLLRDKGLIETDVAKMNMYQLAEEGTLEEFKRRYTGDMLDKRDSCGDKLITYALHGKKWETVYFLLQQSDKVEQEINSLGIGDALRYVIQKRNYPKKDEVKTKDFIAYDEIHMKIIKYYLDHGADVSINNILFVATPRKRPLISDDEMEVINMLLEKNAKLDKVGSDLVREGNPAAYEYYKSRGAVTE